MHSQSLQDQNSQYAGSDGISQENQQQGFRPAFLDTETGEVYPSQFRNGKPAPMHLLDGLPAAVVLNRNPSGKVLAVSASVVSGFIRQGRFFTREQAAEATHVTPYQSACVRHGDSTSAAH